MSKVTTYTTGGFLKPVNKTTRLPNVTLEADVVRRGMASYIAVVFSAENDRKIECRDFLLACMDELEKMGCREHVMINVRAIRHLLSQNSMCVFLHNPRIINAPTLGPYVCWEIMAPFTDLGPLRWNLHIFIKGKQRWTTQNTPT